MVYLTSSFVSQIIQLGIWLLAEDTLRSVFEVNFKLDLRLTQE